MGKAAGDAYSRNFTRITGAYDKVYKVNYRELKYHYFKPQDSWSERFIVQIFSVPIAYLILKLNQSRKLPYVVTALTFVASLIGAGLVYYDFYRTGGILLFCAFVMDNLDGSLARFIYKEDPDLRGTLDFTLDNFVWLPIVLALFSVFLRNGTTTEQFLFFLFVALLSVLYTETTTDHRLRYKLKNRGLHSPTTQQITQQIKEQFDKKSRFFKFLTNMYVQMNNFAKKHRTFPVPTIPDVHVLVYIMIPLLNFQYNIPFITLGILIVTLTVLEEGLVNYGLIQKCRGKF